jgi:hypothetical protein
MKERREGMAKKAKVKKAATTAAKPKPVPTYLQGKKSVDIPVHRVADILAMIDQHGHSAKFKRQAKAAGLAMSLDPKTINFVKDFVANNEMHAHAVGKQVVNSGGSFDCTKPDR